MQNTLRECIAEVVGTFILIFIGNMAVAMAVHTGSMNLWGVAMLWGLAVTLAVYAVGSVSGAHLNPAVTIAMMVFRDFPAKKVIPYILAQISGAFIASGVVYVFWSGFLKPTADKMGVIIGQAGSQKLMAIWSCFYPNPGIVGVDELSFLKVNAHQAFAIELGITAVLVFTILALTEDRHDGAPGSNLIPWFVGLTVTTLVGIAAPLTMAAMNPARDLGPRLFAYLAGFGEIAFPGPRGNEWWIFILGPIAGAIVGGILYERILRPCFGTSELKKDQGIDIVEGDRRRTIE